MRNRVLLMVCIISITFVLILAATYVRITQTYKEDGKQQAFKDIRANVLNGDKGIFAFDVDGVSEMYEIKYIGVGKGDK